MSKSCDVDVIGGFVDVDPHCRGCGAALTVENAWMADGCPCNATLGINNENETRWRLLMELEQSHCQRMKDLDAENERQRKRIVQLCTALASCLNDIEHITTLSTATRDGVAAALKGGES